MSIPRFKDLRVGPRDRRRARGTDPAASQGRSPGRRLNDGPAELNEPLHPRILPEAAPGAPGDVKTEPAFAPDDEPGIMPGHEPGPGPGDAAGSGPGFDEGFASRGDGAIDRPGDTGDPSPGLANHPTSPGLLSAQAALSAGLPADDIPVLTEVVQLSDDHPRVTGSLATDAASTGSLARDGVASGSPATADGNLEQRLTEAVLRRLLLRSGDLLDAQLRDTMAPMMERVAATFARELHEPLEQMIREVVARAVVDELARQRAESADRKPTSRRT